MSSTGKMLSGLSKSSAAIVIKVITNNTVFEPTSPGWSIIVLNYIYILAQRKYSIKNNVSSVIQRHVNYKVAKQTLCSQL